MSDVMLFGVLRMPYEMAMADELSRYQFWQRAQEAADRLENAATQPPQDERGQGEPIGWLKPNESYAPDAFRWARTDTHIKPLFFAHEPSAPPQPVAEEVPPGMVLLPIEPTPEMIEAVRLKYPFLFDAKRFAEDWRLVVNAAAMAGTGSDESKKGEA